MVKTYVRNITMKNYFFLVLYDLVLTRSTDSRADMFIVIYDSIVIFTVQQYTVSLSR